MESKKKEKKDEGAKQEARGPLSQLFIFYQIWTNFPLERRRGRARPEGQAGDSRPNLIKEPRIFTLFPASSPSSRAFPTRGQFHGTSWQPSGGSPPSAPHQHQHKNQEPAAQNYK